MNEILEPFGFKWSVYGGSPRDRDEYIAWPMDGSTDEHRDTVRMLCELAGYSYRLDTPVMTLQRAHRTAMIFSSNH